MTTVFGIRHPKVELSVLVADRQSTSLDQQSGMPIGKYLDRKLWKSDDGIYCFGHAGKKDGLTMEFVQKLSKGDFNVEKVIQKRYFPELRKLNIKRMGRKLPDIQDMSGIILATQFNNNPKLYMCFPLGDVEERIWTCAGSGDQKVTEYMKALQIISEARDYLGDISEPKANDVIRVGLEAVRRSQSQDLYSYGLDMMICSSEGIMDHYSDLDDDFAKKLRKIQRQYKKISQNNK